MLDFLLLVSRTGKLRLSKYYQDVSERDILQREVSALVLNRPARMCNFLECRGHKIVYKRYASLYFVVGVKADANELMVLEAVHHFVEVLDQYFGSVCELDIIFNFHRVHHLLDEVFLNGEVQEVSKREILRAVIAGDDLAEESREREKAAR